MWSRIHLIPLLTAEEDRDLVRRHYADQAREKELLGSQTSPYNSDRYVIPLAFQKGGEGCVAKRLERGLVWLVLMV
jgi:hypothetical protein